MGDMRDTKELEGASAALRTATYLLRFTPEEKAGLEQRVREAAARGKTPMTLADALRGGAQLYLDDFLAKLDGRERPSTDGPAGVSAA